MGFYGNITNTSKTQFSFDKVYSSRYEMASHQMVDGIYAGRYVLVEYDGNETDDTFNKGFFFIEGHIYGGVVLDTPLYTLNGDKVNNDIKAINSVEELTKENEDSTGNPATDRMTVKIMPYQKKMESNQETLYIKITDKAMSYTSASEQEYTAWIQNHTEVKDQDEQFQLYIINKDIVITSNQYDIPIGRVLKINKGNSYTTNNLAEYWTCKIDDKGSYTWTFITSATSNYMKNFNIDTGTYGESRGYDSTVWQKVYNEGVEKYVMIAELNTVVPTFDVTADKPTMTPIGPHFDSDSTNVYYRLHVQPAWGFRTKAANKHLAGPRIDRHGIMAEEPDTILTTDSIFYPSDQTTKWEADFYDVTTDQASKGYYNPRTSKWEIPSYDEETDTYSEAGGDIDAAIYFNKKGLSPDKVVYSEDFLNPNSTLYNASIAKYGWKNKDEILFSATGKSGKVYDPHTGLTDQSAEPDVQELSIMLPSLGDNMAKIWDLIYGGRDTNDEIRLTQKRNKHLEWESANRYPTRDGLRLVDSIDVEAGRDCFTYSPSQVDTLAGCINSVHDLMGMIVVNNVGTKDPNTGEKYSIITDPSILDENKIYYNVDGSYNRKHLGYTYDKINYSYIIKNVTKDTYHENTFYIKDGTNYLPDPEKVFNNTRTYYIKTASVGEQYTPITLDKYEKGYFYNTLEGGLTANNERAIGDFVYEDRDIANKSLSYYTHDNNEDVNKIKVLTGNYESGVYYVKKDDAYELEKEDENAVADPNTTYYEIDKESIKPITQYMENPYFYVAEGEPGAPFYSDGKTDQNGLHTGRLDLTYIYTPNIFYYESTYTAPGATEAVISYKLATENDIIPNTTYYVITEEKQENTSGANDGQWIKDQNGEYIWVADSKEDTYKITRYKVDKMLSLNAGITYYYNWSSDFSDIYDENGEIVYDEEGEPKQKINSYRIVTNKMLYQFYSNQRTFDSSIEDEKDRFMKLYTVNIKEQGNFYIPGAYYYKKNNCYVKDYSLNKTESRQYYEIFNYTAAQESTTRSLIFKKVNKTFYVPYEYYYLDNGVYKIDKSQTYTDGRTYYKKNDLYVLSDSLNLFPIHAIWNSDLELIPNTVELAKRTDKWEFQPLQGFARELNTVHGLILRINQLLEMNDPDTRNQATVQGAINTLKDIIAKFDKIVPGQFMIVDDYGRIHSSDWTTKQEFYTHNEQASHTENNRVGETEDRFILTDINSTPDNSLITFKHMFKGVSDTTTSADKNSGTITGTNKGNNDSNDDNLKLYTPIVDNMGHVVGKNTETVTLPYSYKFYKTDAVSSAVNDIYTTVTNNASGANTSAVSASATNIAASNTKDTLTVNPSNKWIQTKFTDDKLEIAHEIHAINTQPQTTNKNSDNVESASAADKITVQDLAFDNAGHVTMNRSHTYTLPYGFKTISTNGRSTDVLENASTNPSTSNVVAENTQDTLAINSGNKWIRIDTDAENDKITFRHDVHSIVTTQKTSTNLNDGTNTITIQDTTYDQAGHLTANQNHTYTLPYGFKKITPINSDSNAPLVGNRTQVVADNTQDNLNIASANKWIIMAGTETINDNTFSIGHRISILATGIHSNSQTATPNFGSTFNVPVLTTDEAGHLTAHTTEKVTIPEGSYTNTPASTGATGVITGIGFTPTSGAITSTSNFLGDIVLGAYTAPTGGANITSTSTLKGALSTLDARIYTEEEARKALDVSDAAVNGEFVSEVNQTDGKIAVTRTAIAPSVSITAGTSSAAPKINVTVNTKSGTAQSLTTATTGLYGVTKLTNQYTSTNETMAATGKSIAAAIDGLTASDIPDLSSTYITNTKTYSYQPAGQTATTITIEQLIAKVAALEARIAELEK